MIEGWCENVLDEVLVDLMDGVGVSLLLIESYDGIGAQ